MKQQNILKISILPLVLITAITFLTNIQPEKRNNRDKKENQEKVQNGDKGKDQNHKMNDKHSSKGNAQQGNGNSNKNDNRQPDKSDRGTKSSSNKQGKGNSDNFNAGAYKSNGNNKVMNGKRDGNIDWNLDRFADRKNPKNQKKVSVCHNPSDEGSNGVNISISENALQAHLNHGDQIGDCKIDYSDRWSSNYVRSRENVYNTYEQAWETMSYSEALLQLAAQKLLGYRTNLDRERSTLSASEIQRREALVLDLQNNVNSLDNQLGVSRQRLDSNVSIIVTV